MSAVAGIALLLSDVDGTLVNENKVLTGRARDTVLALNETGSRFAITSGRPPRGMAMLIDPLRLDTPIAGFNGGAFVSPDLEPIEQHLLGSGAAAYALGIIESHGLDGWVYTATDWYIRDPDAAHVARERTTVAFEPRAVERFASVQLDGAVKIVAVSDDPERVAHCESAMREQLRGQVSATRSQAYYLDVTHPLANKGVVVETLSRWLGVPNDVLMFKRSGFSIAMANASPSVKAEASATTDSYTDEGFAKAVERYLLGAS